MKRTFITKKTFITTLLSCMIAGALFTAPMHAGQVVTDDVKSWAKDAIESEKALKTAKAPSNSVAVLYFTNRTEMTDLDLLEKGMAIMLMSDLHKVKEIQLVERVKLNAIMNELDLGAAGLIESTSSARVGHLLGAENLIGGDIVKGGLKRFQLKSSLLAVSDEEVFGRPEAEGLLIDELLRMEKDLLFEIIRLLEIRLTPEEELALKEPLTRNMKALTYLFQAVEYSDSGNYTKANEYYQKALDEDPGLDMAETGMFELASLGLVAGVPPSSGEPEGYSETGGDDGLTDKRQNFDRPNDKDKKSSEKIIDIRTEEGTIEVAWEINSEQFDLYSHVQTNAPEGLLADLPGIQDRLVNTSENLNELEDGKYVPGQFNPDGTWSGTQPDDAVYSYWGEEGYTYGLQAVGTINPPAVFMNEDTASGVRGDGFLAYAVQVEEDRLNRKIIDMHRQAIEEEEALSAINTALGHASLRVRDAYLTQKADAQAGRTLKDREGNWTRVQQFMLRPDARTVQMLNATLRGTGDHAGVSAMNWTTKFSGDYTRSLRSLPWNDWLTIRAGEGDKHILYDYSTPVSLASMSVEFTNPGNESLKEELQFTGSDILGRQDVSSETLTLSGTETKTYTNLYGQDVREYYTVRNDSQSPSQPGGFIYQAWNDESDIVAVDFFVVGDIDTVDTEYSTGDTPGFKDIWSALAVNESGLYNSDAYSIGNNTLEIAIDAGRNFFANPIDVVYVPMSRMLWKSEETRTVE